MNQGLWIAKKNKLCFLVKLVSNQHGEEDIDFLRSYCADLLGTYRGDIDKAIRCFESLAQSIKVNNLSDVKHNPHKFIINTCKACGYMPVFCSCSEQ